MNFKRLVITTVIAASQVAMVLPASAEEMVQTNPQSEVNVSGQALNNANTGNLNQNGTVDGTTNPDQGQVDSQIDGQVTDETGGTTVPGSTDEGTGSEGSETGGNTTTTTPPVVDNTSASSTDGKLILMMNSKKMYQNGKEYLAGYPMEVQKGVSYVSIRAIVERAGLQINYDSKTKETIIQRGSDELRFKVNSSSYKVNGVTTKMSGTSYSTKNNFMVPLTAITKALNMPYEWDQKGKRVIVSVSTKPVASFSIGNKEVISGETQVQYLNNAYSPSGLPIVNEEWLGREEMFMTPGQYVVTYRVQDSSGQWSDPFSLTVNVVKPHTPPVANFTTDKETYKMGELITYNDLSTDEVGIKDRDWENRELAFFTPGPVSIKLTVTNQFGLTSSVEKMITITNETLYTRDDFNKIFTPVGDKYMFDGTQVPSWAKVNYSFTADPTTLIRSNSPETVYSEGVVYRETAIGDTRFMIHHANATGKSVKMYVIASNKNTTETARLTQTNLGFAGPNQYATGVGKASVQRYYESLQTGNKYKDMWIAPGESKIILTELSATSMKPGEVISLLADLYSDQTLQYDVIMLDASKDPFKSLPYLSVLPSDIHNRGTYTDATRHIEYSELIGTTPTRLLIGDNSSDPFLVGEDGPTGEYKLNAGNFGVVYTIKLHRVAPNTLITFNPRGGFYTGNIMVNGNIVPIANSSGLSAPNENSVLFRSGDREQTVEFLFTAAPGSNLSVNLLFQPMPEVKQP
ncbi:copper amine oxidase-like protein [Fontibacillus phaseoli]|uniref:Copper amine oxidase-like protein n=1 Tax=Fontibacillus phaseoli TaxID=1416533 RepID=A0A369BNE4_9BACL|nr:stalk domain-containing protein [Fontibacillus phaseoli]RCX23120.1 copper amine oxidase-like protein [Fontibacillus phaseoli]